MKTMEVGTDGGSEAELPRPMFTVGDVVGRVVAVVDLKSLPARRGERICGSRRIVISGRMRQRGESPGPVDHVH